MQPYKPVVPPQIVEAFLLGLDNFGRSNAPDREEFMSAGPTGLPILTLTLDDLGAGNFITNQVGWRLLFDGPAGTGTSAQTLADVATAGRHTTPQVVSFSQHAHVAEFFRQFEQILLADQLSNAEGGFKLALLRIPGLTVDAFWLQSPGGESDVVIPIRGPANLERKQYTKDEFVRTLQPLVEKFRAFNKK